MPSCALLLLACLFGILAGPTCAAQIQVVGAGAAQTILLRGQIVEGDDQQFAAALAQAFDPVVVLASPGGRVLPALAIGRLVRAHKLATVVTAGGDCASACALIWLAGETRRLAESGRIGLHAVSVAQASGGATETHAFDHLLRDYLTGLGYSLDTTATIVNTPAAMIRWMDAAELNAAGIATIAYR